MAGRYPRVRLRVADGRRLRSAFAAIRADLGVPEAFPADVATAAERAADGDPDGGRREDRRDLELVTIDPPGSMDLDQAMHLARRGDGYRVSYAIADVAAFVRAGGPVDEEARRRGETLYAPDTRVPLHPTVLSEDAASLLPGVDRPAVLWTLDLDGCGELVDVDVRRALVRSRERLDYTTAQQRVDAGDPLLTLLAEVGRLRIARGVDRGAVDLPIPEQEVVEVDGGFALAYRQSVPVDRWNAQISLLTGIAGARLMVDGRVGVLRTLPEAPAGAEARLRRTARGLGIEWPDEESWAELVPRLDPARPEVAALVQDSTALLRGAGYTSFDGELPEQTRHAAVAAEYSHVTAPLRRLVDRFAAECCLALCAGTDVPGWVREALPALPARMAAADELAGRLDRACVDLVEAVVLERSVGQVFDAVVVDVREGGGTVALRDPAVRGRCDGDALPLGERVRVRLVEADPQQRSVRFVRA